jgi:DNA anti-recombination protein RmuC
MRTAAGVKTMQRVCAIVLIFIAACAVPTLVRAGAATNQNAAVHGLELQIQAQLERIQHAKDTGSAAMTLARLRVAHQLSRAEQELERHLANLERLKEGLANQVDTLEASCGQTDGENREAISSALSRLQAQIRETDALISRVEALRNDVDEPVVERSPGEASTPGLRSLDEMEVNLGQPSPPPPVSIGPWGHPST